jgi:hypothetical protein
MAALHFLALAWRAPQVRLALVYYVAVTTRPSSNREKPLQSTLTVTYLHTTT